MNKVGVSEEEKNLSYYRFYQQELAPIDEEKLALVEHPSEKTGVPFNDKNLFLKGEDQEYCQIGYGLNADGTAFVANRTYMPNVTSEMLDWWFPWHSVGSDLRYKIWDNEDHYFARADRCDYVCDPSVPIREKTWGVSHYILEDVGNGPDFLKLNFLRPRDFGYDESLIDTSTCSSMVCAIGEGKVAAAMTHKWYPYKNGVMFVSHFWIGMHRNEDGTITKGIPDGIKIPLNIAKGLYAHNIKEFSNLKAILPEVYKENKGAF